MSHLTFDESASALRAALAKSWAPRPRLSVSEAAERHLYLSAEYSKEAGYASFDRYCYLREPIDRLGPDDPVRVVAFKGPIQGGKTIIGQAWLTYIIAEDPGPTIFVTDTDTKARIFSKKRIDLMVRDDPTLNGLVSDETSRTKGNTIQFKTFPGGDIKLVGAQSVTGLTSDTCRYAMIDEADDHKGNVSYAGSSISLAMGRQTTYGDMAKTAIVSSPKVKGDSEIEAWFLRGDQRMFYVPCPHCGEYQILEWQDEETKEQRLVWDRGDPSSARYLCAHCGHAIVNADKNKMLPAAEWRATRPDLGEAGFVTSYALNGLYLPTGSFSWPDMVRQWESAVARSKAGDTDELRTFVNTRLAKTFEPPADAVDATSLASRVEPEWGDIPNGITVIVIGVDVQNDRLEAMTCGFGAGYECWILDYNVIPIDPLDAAAWSALDAIRMREWDFQDGRAMRANVMCIDRQFRTSEVQAYVRTRNNAHATRGQGGNGKPIWDKKPRKGGRGKNEGRFNVVGVDTGKDVIFSMQKTTQPGPRFLHVPEDVVKRNDDIFDQLTAEKRVKIKVSGKTQWVWRKKVEGRPNEALDTLNYCLAGVHLLIASGVQLNTHVARTLKQSTPRDKSKVAQSVEPEHETPRKRSRRGSSKRGDPSGWFSEGGSLYD